MNERIFSTTLITLLMSMITISHVQAGDNPGSVSMFQHQQAMHTQMETIQSTWRRVQTATDAKARKQALHDNGAALQKGVSMLQDMMTAKRADREACLEREKNAPTDNQTCYTAETHQDTYMNMLLLMMQQLLYRQIQTGQ